MKVDLNTPITDFNGYAQGELTLRGLLMRVFAMVDSQAFPPKKAKALALEIKAHEDGLYEIPLDSISEFLRMIRASDYLPFVKASAEEALEASTQKATPTEE
jgi:hypothetical protein